MSNAFVISNDTTVYKLESEKAFEVLNEKEKRYCHHLLQACWEASPIVLLQTSFESAPLFILLLRFFKAHFEQKEQSKTAVSELPVELLVYASHVFANMGNYKSFGDSKFIPAIPKEEFARLLQASPDWKNLEPLWELIQDSIYSLTPRERQLGLGPNEGISTYYSADVEKPAIEKVQKFMDEVLRLSPYNTRLFKTGDNQYELRLASYFTDKHTGDHVAPLLTTYEYEGLKMKVTRGDYSAFMKYAIDSLKAAIPFAENDNQKKMLEEYIASFETGSIDNHKSGSRYWIKDKGPVVETYIGFIESYRDPIGVRGEFEGFVAIVNKEISKKYSILVENAENFLKLLPWSKEFEKDKFLKPDFTSLEVVGFAGSGIPAGINIPNYDDIRQSEGFKNVSLGNVLAARSGKEPVTFLGDRDQQLFQDLQSKAFEVQVAIHELLGHGSGKLFSVDENGKKNFPDNLKDPLSENGLISSYYTPGKTYDSVFCEMGSSLEECRAEAVGIYLCLSQEILNIFGYKEEAAMNEIIYINWLLMVRAGLLSLEYYTPETKKWRQAHMQARHVILKVLLEAGEGLVTIEKIQNENSLNGLVLHLDKSKIQTVGKVAIGKFLQKVQTYKSTANYDKAKQLYDHYSSVNEEFLALREIVLAKKKPRPIYVQPTTKFSDDKVIYESYDATHEGVIKSFVERFSKIQGPLLQLWQQDKHFYALSKI